MWPFTWLKAKLTISRHLSYSKHVRLFLSWPCLNWLSWLSCELWFEWKHRFAVIAEQLIMHVLVWLEAFWNCYFGSIPKVEPQWPEIWVSALSTEPVSIISLYGVWKVGVEGVCIQSLYHSCSFVWTKKQGFFVKMNFILSDHPQSTHILWTIESWLGVH